VAAPVAQPNEPACAGAVFIALMEEHHWEAVCDIYQAGIATGHGTFAAEPPATWGAWERDHLGKLSLVGVDGSKVVGWAALAPVSGRCVYAGVAEVSVYVAPEAQGRRVGWQLLSALIGRSEAKNLWTLQAGIFPENQASVASLPRVSRGGIEATAREDDLRSSGRSMARCAAARATQLMRRR
jgi:phosphinothricin acetyltransferase